MTWREVGSTSTVLVNTIITGLIFQKHETLKGKCMPKQNTVGGEQRKTQHERCGKTKK